MKTKQAINSASIVALLHLYIIEGRSVIIHVTNEPLLFASAISQPSAHARRDLGLVPRAVDLRLVLLDRNQNPGTHRRDEREGGAKRAGKDAVDRPKDGDRGACHEERACVQAAFGSARRREGWARTHGARFSWARPNSPKQVTRVAGVHDGAAKVGRKDVGPQSEC